MTVALVIQIGRDLLLTALLLAAPALVVSLVVGVLVSIFQAVTSINEQTLTFVPRIVAVGLTMVITLPWSLRVITSFTQRMLQLMSQLTP